MNKFYLFLQLSLLCCYGAAFGMLNDEEMAELMLRPTDPRQYNDTYWRLALAASYRQSRNEDREFWRTQWRKFAESTPELNNAKENVSEKPTTKTKK